MATPGAAGGDFFRWQISYNSGIITVMPEDPLEGVRYVEK